MELKPCSFGLAGGILWALSLFVLTLVAMSTGYAMEVVDMLSPLYVGYEASTPGLFIGAFWAFLDAFIGLYIFAWLYNVIAKKCKK